MTKRRTAALVIVALSVTAVGGFVAGSRITSPAEVASRSSPPAPSLILVPVEERVLSSNVVSRGTGRFGSPQKLSIATSALKSTPGLVAAAPALGANLSEGDVVLSASGRPLFLLSGVRPMGRDLGPGTAGDDVRQLETALRRLGFDPGPLDGNYDEETAAAVASWYAAKGYAAFTATADQLANVRSREAELVTASLDTLGADDTLAGAEAALSGARLSVDTARRRTLSTAHNIERARSEAAVSASAAAAELAARQMVLDGLLATKQPAAADVATAQADLRLAKSIAETQRLAGERALAEAGAAAADATDELNAKQALLLAAEKAVANASTATSARRAALSSATRARDLASRRAGVQVPADEVVFVASSPVRVSESLVGLGDPATGGVAKVTDAVVHIEGALAVNDANLVKATMRVKVEEPDLGIATEGTVTSVAAAPGTNGVDGFHVFVEIAVVAPPANLVGASVRLTIPVRSSGGPVLAVPLSALSLAPDGSSRVQRDKGEGATEFVTVEAGLSTEGYVAVTAGDASLKVGDRVVAGLAQNG